MDTHGRAADVTSEAALAVALASFADGDWEQAYSELAALDSAGATLPVDAFEALAISAFKVGRLAEACQAMERAFAASVNEDKRRAAMAAARLVALYEAMGADSACNGWEQRGLRLLEDLEPCVERGYLALARTGCEVHDPAELEERADLALQLAETFGDKDLELRARADKGLALVCRGYVNAGFALLDEVMVSIAAGELLDHDMRARSVCSMLSACERTGDIARADYWCRRIEQEPNLQHVVLGAHCRVTYGVVEALRGEWQQAEAVLTEAMQAAFAMPYHRAVSAGRLAEILIQQGRHQSAAQLLTGYEDRLEAIPALARLRMIDGQYEKAAGLLRSALRSLGQDSIRLAPVLAELVEVELLRDDRPAAEHLVERLRSLDERCESNEIRAYARLAAGRVARHAGQLDRAVEELEIALTLLNHYERPLLQAHIHLELARALNDMHAVGQATVEAEVALATFSRLGVMTDAAAAESLLARLAGLTRQGTSRAVAALQRPDSANGSCSLTPRESEVAVLVAQGLTNREIAERLVLSVRTVEGHVDRVLGKLGFHTRTQLALWVR